MTDDIELWRSCVHIALHTITDLQAKIIALKEQLKTVTTERDQLREELKLEKAAEAVVYNPATTTAPANPAPRWHVRSSLGAAEARIYALVAEAGELARGLDAEASAKLRVDLLEALEGRR